MDENEFRRRDRDEIVEPLFAALEPGRGAGGGPGPGPGPTKPGPPRRSWLLVLVAVLAAGVLVWLLAPGVG